MNRYERGTFTVRAFFDGLDEYRRRLDPWDHAGRRVLDRWYGHMTDRAVAKTEAAMGGRAAPHDEGCSCKECEGWELRCFPELERGVGTVDPLDAEEGP